MFGHGCRRKFPSLSNWSTLAVVLTEARTYNYYMLNQSTKLRNIDNSRFPNVKPTNVRAFLQKHGKEALKKVALEL